MPTELQDQLSKMRRESEERDAQRRAKTYGLSYLDPKSITVDLNALALVSKTDAEEGRCAVIEQNGTNLAIIAEDPKYSKTQQIIKGFEEQKNKVVVYVVSNSSINYALGYYSYTQKKREKISGAVKMQHDKKEDKQTTLQALSSMAKVKKAIVGKNDPGKVSELLQVILLGAIANRASDVHIEPEEKSIKLRYRIDGVLNDVFDKFSPQVYRPVLSRIKLLSNLKLNVKDKPQDGRFTIDFPQKDIEVRVAIAPSEFGEVVVMRLLDPEAINLQLQDMGFREDDMSTIDEELKRPHGMILNTGPTGSGKTTTLYGFLNAKHNSGIKTITIEDPIEYHLEGIEQTQVDPDAGYTFASGLRSLMRQDPDVILVGEIRDQETAAIAVQAALTGHLLFSTIHANEAAAGIPRLLDLGVKSLSLAPALNLLIAQRLVRRLCEKCRVKKDIDPKMKEQITKYVSALPKKINAENYIKNMVLYESKGCEVCSNTGYKGRVAAFELLPVTPAIQELITKESGQIEIQKTIDESGFVSMQQDGVLKVISGVTTFEEIEKATGKIVW